MNRDRKDPMRFWRILQFMVVGAVLGGLGGLLLPSFRGLEGARLGLSTLAHLALLGALIASAGPLVERHWTKLFAAWVAGGVGLVGLTLAVMGLAQLQLGGVVEVLVIIATAGLFPAIVAFADCLADELYRAILFETMFSAFGGVIGLALAWRWMDLGNERLPLLLPAAIYSAVIWLGMGLAKRIEESEEELEAEEERTETGLQPK